MTTDGSAPLFLHRIEGPRTAPVLVLSNSLGTDASMWDPQMSELTQYFRVLRYEHRGHGGSPAPPGPYSIGDLGGDVLSLLDELGIETASFVGLSLGGMVGMWLAARRPSRIDRLVLCCTAPKLGSPESWHERAAAVRGHGVSSLTELLLGRWFTPAFLEQHPDVRASFAAMLGAADPEGYAACCEAIAAMDMSADLAQIVAPTLIVAGAEDPVVPPELALGVQQRVPRSGLVILSGAAHLPNVELVPEINQLLLDHLLGSAPVRGLEVRRQVLGRSYVDRALGGSTPFSDNWQALITRYAWGEIWARPGLDRSTRRLITLGMLIALGRFEELELHLRAALENGTDAETLREVLLHSAVYAGVPAANAAFKVASTVLSDAGMMP